jgi:hypothetical protein
MPFFNATLTDLDKKEIKRYAGLAKADFSEKIIDEAATEALILAKPRAVWNIYDYDSKRNLIHAQGKDVSVEGKSITKHLQNSLKVIVFSLTIGEEIENAINSHFKEGIYSHSLILDAAATTAVEAAADLLEKAVSQSVNKEGLYLIQRFSPGYGDFDIHFQPEMLALSDAKSIGISLTESYMLLPRKSITAIIGLTAKQRIQCRAKNNCQNCASLNCISRKELSNDKNN